MTRGSVSKLVTTFGSRWGRIQPEGQSREVFFNASSLDGAVDFLSLELGQLVNFEEHADHINGSHAEHVSPAVMLSSNPGKGPGPGSDPEGGAQRRADVSRPVLEKN